MASVIFNPFKLNAFRAKINFDTDTFHVMLVTSAYAPDIDAHEFRSDVTNEVVGTGYTAGGAATAVVMALNALTDTVEVDLGDVVWPASSITARGGVVYKNRGGLASADELVGYIDFGADKTSVASDFTFHATAPLGLT